MVSQFTSKLMNKDANPDRACNFKDISKETEEMKYYILLSCKLGIMGLQSD